MPHKGSEHGNRLMLLNVRETLITELGKPFSNNAGKWGFFRKCDTATGGLFHVCKHYDWYLVPESGAGTI